MNQRPEKPLGPSVEDFAGINVIVEDADYTPRPWKGKLPASTTGEHKNRIPTTKDLIGIVCEFEHSEDNT